MNTVKSSEYFGFQRQDLIAMLPAIEGRYLEIGCGDGATLEYLKSMGASHVAGVDINEDAIARARSRDINCALIANIEADELPFEKNYFDCIILADVLEHLKDPWTALKGMTSYLKQNGFVLISIPNIGYYKILKKLIVHDEWTYVDQGILDNTHVRFFTLKEAKKLVAGAGLNIVNVKGIYIAGVFFRLFNMAMLNALKPFSAYQYYILAKRVHVD